MMTTASKVIMTVILLTFANTATAEDMGHAPWQIDLGVTRLAMVDKADVAAVGTQIPGAGADSDAQVVPSITVTRFVTATVGFSLASGLPPKIRYNGSGTLASAGRLIDVRYAAPALTIVWSPFRTRGIAPYVGAGATYMHVLSTRDGALQGSEVDDDLGPVAQAGVTFFSGRRWGIYVDVKKAFVRTKAYGLFGPAPVEARLRMDPVVAQAGVSLRL